MSTATSNMAEIAALIGDPARANILDALLGGRALTATELAYVAGVSASTASGHLGKMTAARLLTVLQQGRHRYYRLASPLVAQMLESICAVASIEGPPRYRPHSKRDELFCEARTCYNHLAGRIGVALADALGARRLVILGDEGGEITPAGLEFLGGFGIAPMTGRRRIVRACLDMTERRHHLGGVLGAALASRCFDLGWVDRQRDTRALAVTPAGRAGLSAVFGIDLDAFARESALIDRKRLSA
jgi:DNA-binding transcriptional ArsR family regulator